MTRPGPARPSLRGIMGVGVRGTKTKDTRPEQETAQKSAFSSFIVANQDHKPIHLQPLYMSLNGDVGNALVAETGEVSYQMVINAIGESLFRQFHPDWNTYAVDCCFLEELPSSATDLFDAIAEAQAFKVRRTKITMKCLGSYLVGDDRVSSSEQDRGNYGYTGSPHPTPHPLPRPSAARPSRPGPGRGARWGP